MKQKLLSLLALVGLLTAPVAYAQVPNLPATSIYAIAYGGWLIQSQSPNTFTFFPVSVCQIGGIAGNLFPAFSSFGTSGAKAPVWVVDGTPANNEVLIPSALVNTSSLCGVTVAPANTHTSFSLRSGTAGLQDALNSLAVQTSTYPVAIILDKNWYTAAAVITGKTPAGIIAAATGSASAYLVDETTAPYTYYQWNGTSYTAVSGAVGGRVAPTVATSTGAGTGGTATITGNGSIGTVKVNTGTSPTASATVFTLTWPTAANGGFAYAPACTFTSVGSTAYTTGTNASVYTPPAVNTVTASSSALTASQTGVYAFRYECK